MTPDGFKRLALSLPDTAEGSHFGNVDFRVGGKIFATLAHVKDGYCNLMLTREQQDGLVADAPDVFLQIPNGWGKAGATHVRLAKVNKEMLLGVLKMAWRNRAPKKVMAANPEL